MAKTLIAANPVHRRPAGLAPSSPSSLRKNPAPRRIASNFVFLSLAEIVCRGASVAVTLALASRLGMTGYGRIEFAFNIVFWLVLFVRDAFEMLISRELARHPRLIRPLVNHVLAIKGSLSIALFLGLFLVGSVSLATPADRAILTLYGLLLLTTALGIDFVYRGTERMGLVAISLCFRTLVYAIGVWLTVHDAARIVWVPAWLALGEASGIALVWCCYTRQYGLPRPVFALRFVRVFLRRGRSVCLIQISQTLIGSADLLVVAMLSEWAEVGEYGAPHRMVTAILTFGMIFQQVSFPMLSRSWRQAETAGREALDVLVKVLMLGLIPIAVGGAVLSGPIVHLLLNEEYSGARLLLAIGIWRAPILALAYLYQSTLIAFSRESAGVRLLLGGGLASGPMVAGCLRAFGLPGACAAVLVIGLVLVAAGWGLLARERRQPAWHHHLARPLLAALAMVPVSLFLERVHVVAAVAGGAAVYVLALYSLGGLRREDLRAVFTRR